MSVASKLPSGFKTAAEPRSILGPGGNRFRIMEESKVKKEVVKKPQQQEKPMRLVCEETKQKKEANSEKQKKQKKLVDSLKEHNASVDSSCCSSDSRCSEEIKKKKIVSSGRRIVNHKNGLRAVKVVPEDDVPVPVKRCDWITPNSDPLYTYFHDEEWGVPVHEDRKLFELLVLSQALAEHSWSAILNKRDVFSKLFDNFDPSSIAQYSDKKLFSLKALLSEPKLRAIVENAKQILKVQQELGSFSNYCWGFVNHKPIRNDFRYARQVPAKTPKAELMSKDMMQRGFRCVGPTVVYSFMQVAGIVNDHLLTCFRYQKCNNANVAKDLKPKDLTTEALEDTR